MENINFEIANQLINANLKLWGQNEQLREKNHEQEKCIEVLENRLRIIKEDNNKINENKKIRFQRALKNGKIFIYDTSDENFRGFGKTTEITRYALEHNFPIVVGSPSLRRHI